MSGSRIAGKVFLDTNVLVYAQDADNPAKRRRSRACIKECLAAEGAVISTQVMQEFYVSVTQKLRVEPLAARDLVRALHSFEVVPVSPALIEEAIEACVLHRLSFWDTLILSAAAQAGCASVFTDDLNPARRFWGCES